MGPDRREGADAGGTAPDADARAAPDHVRRLVVQAVRRRIAAAQGVLAEAPGAASGLHRRGGRPGESAAVRGKGRDRWSVRPRQARADREDVRAGGGTAQPAAADVPGGRWWEGAGDLRSGGGGPGEGDGVGPGGGQDTGAAGGGREVARSRLGVAVAKPPRASNFPWPVKG